MKFELKVPTRLWLYRCDVMSRLIEADAPTYVVISQALQLIRCVSVWRVVRLYLKTNYWDSFTFYVWLFLHKTILRKSDDELDERILNRG